MKRINLRYFAFLLCMFYTFAINVFATQVLTEVTIDKAELGQELLAMQEETTRTPIFTGNKVVFLGKTRSGKSTVINFLAKKHLEVIDHDGEFLLQLKEGSKGLVIGHEFSETKCPKCLKIKGIPFYDSPGFEDTGDLTRGEVNKVARELINGMLIRQLFTKGMVKIVWVIRQRDLYDSTRSLDFIDLIKTLFTACPSIAEMNLGMGIVITSCSSHLKKKHIESRLRRCSEMMALSLDLLPLKKCIDKIIEKGSFSLFHVPDPSGKIIISDRSSILSMIASLRFAKLTFEEFPFSQTTNSHLHNLLRGHFSETVREFFTENPDIASLSELAISAGRMSEASLRSALLQPRDSCIRILIQPEFCHRRYVAFVDLAMPSLYKNLREHKIRIFTTLAIKLQETFSAKLNQVRDKAVRDLDKAEDEIRKTKVLTSIIWDMEQILDRDSIHAFQILATDSTLYEQVSLFWQNAVKERKAFLELKKKGDVAQAQAQAEQTRLREISSISASQQMLAQPPRPIENTPQIERWSEIATGAALIVRGARGVCVLI